MEKFIFLEYDLNKVYEVMPKVKKRELLKLIKLFLCLLVFLKNYQEKDRI